MPGFTLLQLSSVAITAIAISAAASSATWLSWVFSLGFVHYFLGLAYSRRQLVQVAGRPATLVPFLVVLAAGAALYLNDTPLYLYFAFHHAFNEVYVRSVLHAGLPGAALRRTAAVVFHLAAYTLVITANIASTTVLAGLAVLVAAGFITYMTGLLRVRRELGASRLVDLCAFEIVMLALVPVAFFYDFTFEQIVFYHFVFWALYPLSRMLEQGRSAAGLRYVALSGGALAVFLFLSPIGPSLYNAPVRVFYDQFIVWSYVHITLSFALSSAHPRWITAWFSPSPAGARAHG